MPKEKGQSLIEVLVGLVIAAIFVGALFNLVINGLKNAQFAKNQALATKYAQAALDQVRTIRDRNILIDTTNSSFFDYLANNCSLGPCYFSIGKNTSGENTLIPQQGAASYQNLENGLKRQIAIQYNSLAHIESAAVISLVVWSDSAGDHESNLQTILTP